MNRPLYYIHIIQIHVYGYICCRLEKNARMWTKMRNIISRKSKKEEEEEEEKKKKKKKKTRSGWGIGV